MADANDFFTLQSLYTFAGTSSATLFVANGFQYAFNINPRWLALAVAEFVCVGLVAVTQIDGAAPVAASPYFVAFLNGFLIYCSAAGLTAVGADVRGASSGENRRSPDYRVMEAGSGEDRRGFWRPWH